MAKGKESKVSTPKEAPKNINNSKESGKKANVEDEQKRPGSAVSQQFQPKKQQNVTSSWRKHEEQQKQQQQQNSGPFGYVPFKTAPLPIYGTYGIRGGNAYGGGGGHAPMPTANQRTTQQILTPAEYLHSTYAPPQALRPESAMAPPRETGNLAHRGGPGGPLDSRPGSELSTYLNPSSKMPSRYQSYTTLPRPEHVEIDEMHHFHPQITQFQQNGVDSIYGQMARGKSPISGMYGEKQNIYGISQMPRRPPSAMSSGMNGVGAGNGGPTDPYMLSYLAGAYGIKQGALGTEEDMHGRMGLKPIVDWGSLNLSSCLQILFGSCIFALGVARMFLRADYAKGQELFYGISVVCAGLVGYFSVRHRSYCMAVSCFALSIVNSVLVFVPFLSGILPLIPLLTAASSGKPSISISGTNEPIEVDLALAILSLLQFAASLIVSLYGCRAIGSTIGHVEQLRLQQHQQQQCNNNAHNGGGGNNNPMGGIGAGKEGPLS